MIGIRWVAARCPLWPVVGVGSATIDLVGSGAPVGFGRGVDQRGGAGLVIFVASLAGMDLQVTIVNLKDEPPRSREVSGLLCPSP